MGLPPAYIFIVRHGSRLDAADQTWHLTSPVPYDPPLTYGGWLQSKALGARIGSILADAASAPQSTAGPGTKHRRRHFRVVVHSSPYLRCVQTAVGIGTGITQPAAVATYQEEEQQQQQQDQLSTHESIVRVPGGSKLQRTMLRLDPFLGEWLNPEYFESITPPPSSALMLVSAKAELLRRDDLNIISYPAVAVHSPSPLSSSLWMSPILSPLPRDGSDNVAGLAHALPRIPHATTTTTVTTTTATTTTTGYVAPIPNYAVGLSCRIPDGYVAHAKDACVFVDYQWDSSREPLGWGDGGTLGEEWPAMHRRFRKGLEALVNWYSTESHLAGDPAMTTGQQDEETKPDTEPDMGPQHQNHAKSEASDPEPNSNSNPDPNPDGEADGESKPETVIILVSHGAGCNAMMGAITCKPVLLDVSVASLTVAVRNAEAAAAASGGGGQEVKGARVAATATATLDNMYDITMIANTDHFRSPSVSSSTHSIQPISILGPAFRSRRSSMSTYSRPIVGPISFHDPTGARLDNDLLSPPMTAVGNVIGTPRRASGSSVGRRSPRLDLGGPASISAFDLLPPRAGLWSNHLASCLAEEDEEDDYDNIIFPDFDQKKLPSPVMADEKSAEGGEDGAVGQEDQVGDEPVGHGTTPQPPPAGLWTGSRGEFKRRWTVNEA